MENEWYWLFRLKKNGWVTISRHAKPDFVAGLTINQIRQQYDRKLIRFKHGSFDYEGNNKEEGDMVKLRSRLGEFEENIKKKKYTKKDALKALRGAKE